MDPAKTSGRSVVPLTEPSVSVQTFLWQAVAQAPDAILICDRDGIIEYANDRVRSVFGYEPSFLVGQPVELLVPIKDRGGHRADRLRYVADPTPRPMGIGLELSALSSDGTEIPVEISLSSVQGDDHRVIAVIRDVTEQRKAERTMRNTLRMLEATHDALYLFDTDTFRYSYANNGACRQTGYSREQLLSMTPLHLMEATTVEQLRARVAPLLRGDVELLETESVLIAADGRRYTVEGTIQLVETTPGSSSFLAMVRDVSERRKLLDAIEAQRDHLSRVFDALQDGVVELDLEAKRIVRVNDQFCVTVGYPEAAILAEPSSPSWMEIDEFEDLCRRLVGTTTNFEVELRGRDGRPIPAALHATQISEPDGQMLWVLIFNDLTQERAAAAVLADARSRIAISDDRDRIARDLHDTVIQRLFATGMSLQAALARPDPRDRIERAVAGIDEAIRALRTSIFTMRSADDTMNIVDTLLVAVEEARRLLTCPVHIEFDGAIEAHLSANVGEDVVALVRETLSNAAKHSHANLVTVVVSTSGDTLNVEIVDDGVGFDPSALTGGQGLRNLRNRSEHIGGRCTITSTPGNGTRTHFAIPIR
jgi:PAS domain S-box-containing protein